MRPSTAQPKTGVQTIIQDLLPALLASQAVMQVQGMQVLLQCSNSSTDHECQEQHGIVATDHTIVSKLMACCTNTRSLS